MQVILDRARRQVELLRDLLVTQTLARQPDDLQLAGGQFGKVRVRLHQIRVNEETVISSSDELSAT